MGTSTTFSLASFKKGKSLSAMKTVLLVLCGLLFFSASSQAQTTYYWRGTTNSAWSNDNNWNTAKNGSGLPRTTPLATDILIFDGSIGATFPSFIVVDYGNGNAPTSQTINQLRFVNNARVTFAGPTNANDGSILNIAGGLIPSANSDDFFVESGSSLSVVASGNTSNRFLLMKIGAGKKGLVNGTITFNAGSNTFTRLVPNDARSLVFTGTSATFNATTVKGSPFGTTGSNTLTANNGQTLPADFTEVTVGNAVVFNSGSTYNHQDGLSPFSVGSTPVSEFNNGSFYNFTGGTFSTNGQTYGNLQMGANATVTGTNAFVVLNNFYTSGTATVSINVTGGTTINAIQDLSGGAGVVGGTTLNFNPPAASSLTVQGNTSINGFLNVEPTSSAQFNVTFASFQSFGECRFFKVNGSSTGEVVFGTGGLDVINYNILEIAPYGANTTFLGNYTNGSSATSTFYDGTSYGNVIFKKNVYYANSFNVNTLVASTVIFDGTSAQLLTGTIPVTFGVNVGLEVNNPNGLTMQQSVTTGRELRLTQGLITTSRGSGLLTMPASAVVTGGSNTSYVNGPVARNTAAGASSNMVFPVGKNGNYRPMTLNITAQTNTGTVTYIGEQQETAPNQSFASGSNLTRVSFKRYFQLAPNVVPTGFAGTVTLSFGTDDFVNYPADVTFVIAKNDAINTPWTNIGRSTNTGTASNGAPVTGTLTSASFTAFAANNSNFALASTSTAKGFPGQNPLPVELTKFAATAKAKTVNVEWATASEKNSSYFEVQRSADSETFQAIGKVQAQGSTSAAHTYALVDKAPLAGMSYYRLRQVDADGTASYSPVVSVSIVEAGQAVVYPNPSSSVIYLGGVEGTVKYRVFNGQGKALLTGETNSSTGVNIQALPTGVYMLEMVTEGGRSSKRFVRE